MDAAAPDPVEPAVELRKPAPVPVDPAAVNPAAVEPADLRASDADRQAVAEQLHTAAAEGRLTMDELAERLDVVYAARTYAELAPVTRDLPGASGIAAPQLADLPVDLRKGRFAEIVPGVGGPPVSVAVMGGSTRAGNWVVPEQHTAVAFMGGVELDLRHARFAAAEVTIIAVAVMGGIEITVPYDLSVEVDGFAFMGGFERHGAGERPSGPRVRITGFALMGGVEVKREKPPELGAAGSPELTA